MKFTILATLTLMPIAGSASAQSPPKNGSSRSGPLYEAIAQADKTAFDAFNAHDLKGLMAMFTSDLEFYHDTGGLSDQRGTTTGFKRMFGATPDVRRELEPGSLEVYPVKDYGAMEIGEHRFIHRENGKEEVGTFHFAIVWRKTGNTWQMARVLSYGH